MFLQASTVLEFEWGMLQEQIDALKESDSTDSRIEYAETLNKIEVDAVASLPLRSETNYARSVALRLISSPLSVITGASTVRTVNSSCN